VAALEKRTAAMQRLAQEKAAAQAAVQRLEAGAAAAAKAFDAEQARPPRPDAAAGLRPRARAGLPRCVLRQKGCRGRRRPRRGCLGRQRDGGLIKDLQTWCKERRASGRGQRAV
jgi:hypothetical protein